MTYGCTNRHAPAPSASLSPADVVRTQVLALQHVNEPTPNAGIWTAFQFASPANHEVTGPYGHFLQVIKSPSNRPFLHARSVRFYPLRQADSQAEQEVELTDEAGNTTRWLFVVSKQREGRFENCWMTVGVAPVEREAKAGTLPPS
jgi:hypothetical protein